MPLRFLTIERLLLGACAALIGGCASPRAEFRQATARCLRAAGELQTVVFTSSIETHGLAGQQLVYKVGLLDARSKPIKSTDGRYQDAAGNVAAGKTLMVWRSPWTFDAVRVSMPARELGVRAADLPVSVEFGVYRPDGECLARAHSVLPLGTLGRQVSAGPRRAGALAPRARRPISTRAAPARRGRPVPVQRRGSGKGAESQAAEAFAWLQRTTTTVRTWLDDAWCQLGLDQHTAPPEPPVASPPASAVPPTAPAPASAPAAEEQPRPDRGGPDLRTYVVQPGDTLSHIALRLLGDASRWREIYELNLDRLDSPDQLHSGIELRIPPAAEGAAREGE